LQRLRAGTRDQHRRLEDAVALSKRLSSLEDYRGLLKAFYGLYSPLEARLASHEPLSHTGLAADRLQKHQLLEQDLLALGQSPHEIESLPRCFRLPEIGNLFAAAGCLYVLEGATLGGQVVRREVGRRLTLAGERGCTFFASYGARVGEMWTDFCERLTSLAAGDSQRGDSIVKGARDTFACFEEWMS
jgi:heme oxygenase